MTANADELAKRTPPGADHQVARPDLRPDAEVQPEDLELPLLRARGRGGLVDLGGVPRPAAKRDLLRHPLRDTLVTPRQSLRGRAHSRDHAARSSQVRGEVRHDPRRSRLHHQRGVDRPRGRRRDPRPRSRRPAARARSRRPPASRGAQALFLEERQVASRLRVPRREPARLLGGQRLSHARRPLAGRALFRSGNPRDAADARGGCAQAPGPLEGPTPPSPPPGERAGVRGQRRTVYTFPAPRIPTASISTRNSGAASAFTSTSVDTGKSPVKTSRLAFHTSSRCLMSVTKMSTFTMSFMVPPAASIRCLILAKMAWACPYMLSPPTAPSDPRATMPAT